MPEGFSYRENVISENQEADLFRIFETLPFKPFEFHGYLGNRRIVSFGWQYDYVKQALRTRDALPDFLKPLRKEAADFAGLESSALQQALITEYAPGAGIGWHRDKPMFEDVLAFSFLSPCRLRFRRKENEAWERAMMAVAPRSLYLLRGPARWDWYHSIPPLSALRYSVTFRNFAPERGV
ncbi:MAG: alpha-ketoglutarate-dependent dioxygenase AlkB [Rhizomicrobium sp.]